MSSPGQPVTYSVLVPTSPAGIMQSMLSLPAGGNYFDGYEVRQVTWNSFHVTRRYVPVWAIVVAIAGAVIFLPGFLRRGCPKNRRRDEPRHRRPAQWRRNGSIADRVPGESCNSLSRSPRTSLSDAHNASARAGRWQDLPRVRGNGPYTSQKLQVLRLSL
jgi:hypothetical protein